MVFSWNRLIFVGVILVHSLLTILNVRFCWRNQTIVKKIGPPQPDSNDYFLSKIKYWTKLLNRTQYIVLWTLAILLSVMLGGILFKVLLWVHWEIWQTPIKWYDFQLLQTENDLYATCLLCISRLLFTWCFSPYLNWFKKCKIDQVKVFMVWRVKTNVYGFQFLHKNQEF